MSEKGFGLCKKSVLAEKGEIILSLFSRRASKNPIYKAIKESSIMKDLLPISNFMSQGLLKTPIFESSITKEIQFVGYFRSEYGI